jgi:aspartate dehydrogenase
MKQKAKIKIGVLGCGTIGSYLISKISQNYSAFARVEYICDHHEALVKNLKKEYKNTFASVTFLELLKKSDLIIEAASPITVMDLMNQPEALNKDFLLMSVGGLILKPQLTMKFLKKFKGRLYLPSGAIAGIDGLLAATEAGLKSVTLKTSKPPAGLREADYFKTNHFPRLTKTNEVCVFKGTAAQAIKHFPQNVNVAALLSVAGKGSQQTQVEIWTSNKYKLNTHEVLIEAKSGKMSFKIENTPSQHNPKTSALAFYSADAALRRIFSNLHIGT